MTLGFEVLFASIAAILTIVSYKTLRAIRHLGVGKSFWMPMCVSSIIFITGSAMAILDEAGFSLPTYQAEVVFATRIVGLIILTCGVYSYSRKVTGSLKEEFSVPEQLLKERLNVNPIDTGNIDLETPSPAEDLQEKRTKKTSNEEPTQECQHRLGYLQTLPKDASIPNECLGCDRIIECKHSVANVLDPRPPAP
ncbi:MAG: hypothetical protein JSW72_04870 [Candidatus Bathyarchaeota archaeon]|nr:MAG: hypothetical protein JSW72_04870 [Candidatus Bathyarchaeota archaeon]